MINIPDDMEIPKLVSCYDAGLVVWNKRPWYKKLYGKRRFIEGFATCLERYRALNIRRVYKKGAGTNGWY